VHCIFYYYKGGAFMNHAMKNQIISELDGLPDQKAYSLLDYLHFLKQEQKEYFPNNITVEAIKEVETNKENLRTYDSAKELFDDLSIET
jgi:hypothetical protein